MVKLSPDVSMAMGVISYWEMVCILNIDHLWYVDHQNVLYNGHICVNQSKKSQVPKGIITHWKNDECE